MIGVPPAFAEDRSEARLPVTVITGFLGSGKTTLVKHILTNQHGLRTAVIVNEFSELGIDSELIVSADDDMVELENGCICCSINNNFMDSIFRILARDRKVDYLVVETTGLADPLPVVLTFLRTEFRDLTRVDSIITVADAGSFCLDLFESEAARNQLRYGDVILLNKCDLVDAQRLHNARGEHPRHEGGRAHHPHHAVQPAAPAHPQRRPVPVGSVLRRSGSSGRRSRRTRSCGVASARARPRGCRRF